MAVLVVGTPKKAATEGFDEKCRLRSRVTGVSE